jgi:TRAP-type C4-dicarboxylate transport system permease small subunit
MTPERAPHTPKMFDLPHYELSLSYRLRRSARIFLLFSAGGITFSVLGFATIVGVTYFSRAGIQWTSAVAIAIAGFAPMAIVGAIYGISSFVRLTLDEITGRPPEHLRKRVRTKRVE